MHSIFNLLSSLVLRDLMFSLNLIPPKFLAGMEAKFNILFVIFFIRMSLLVSQSILL